MPQDIKFGTDGWRAVIADDFTFENVRRVAGAGASYFLKNEDAARGIIVGYDTRFASQRAARVVAEVFSHAGIAVRLSNEAAPTPAISFAAKNGNAAGGVVITSSHNPWNWNGVKFKAKFGGSATPAIMKAIEGELRAEAMPEGQAAPIEEADLKPAYIQAICGFADLELIARSSLKFAVDAMHGAGRGVLTQIFRERGIQHVAIRQDVNPLFPGINPEPIEPHIALLRETVLAQHCHAGFATDGDADRIGAVAEDGSFVDAHKIFAVLLQWLLDRRKWPGDIVRAFNTTGMLDRIAARYGRKLHECPIGFKYVADLMMKGDILIGGEESGGIGYSRFLPERDGILNSLLLANVMAEEGKPLGELVADLQREYGPHFYGRRDLQVGEETKRRTIERALSGDTTRLGKHSIIKKQDLDGVKFFLDVPARGHGADAWILFRVSGTEPLLRVYAEASSPELVEEILADGQALVNAG